MEGPPWADWAVRTHPIWSSSPSTGAANSTARWGEGSPALMGPLYRTFPTPVVWGTCSPSLPSGSHYSNPPGLLTKMETGTKPSGNLFLEVICAF